MHTGLLKHKLGFYACVRAELERIAGLGAQILIFSHLSDFIGRTPASLAFHEQPLCQYAVVDLGAVHQDADAVDPACHPCGEDEP